MKITSNGKYPYEYIAIKTQLLLKGRKYILGEVEVAVPIPPPVFPTEAVCQSLYPCPVTPEPPQPPEPIPPQPDWDAGWVKPSGIPHWDSPEYNKMFPSIEDGVRPLAKILYEDTGLNYANLDYWGPYEKGAWGAPPARVCPLQIAQEFFYFFYNFVPKSINGTPDSFNVAMTAHLFFRGYVGNVADFYCVGDTWYQKLHGFNCFVGYDKDPLKRNLYYYDVFLSQPPTLVKPGTITRMYAYDAG